MSTQSERLAEQRRYDTEQAAYWSKFRGQRWTWIRPGLQVVTDKNGDLAWTPSLDVALRCALWNGYVVVDADRYIELGILVDRFVFPVGCASRVAWEHVQPKPSYWKRALYEMTRRGWFWVNGILAR